MPPNDLPAPAVTIEAIADAHRALMQRLSARRTPAVLDTPVTMSQLRLLHVVAALGDVHMSDLVGYLGVTISTISGHVDRLVEQGYLSRRDDPADRRQVVVAVTPDGAAVLDGLRELGVSQLLELLGQLDATDLEHVARAFAALHRSADELGIDAAAAIAASGAHPSAPQPPRKDPT